MMNRRVSLLAVLVVALVITSGFIPAVSADEILMFASDEKEWVIGGEAEWSVRSGHTSVVYDGKMWVMGGYGVSRKNDVWWSTDGITWTQATASAKWSVRSGHTSVVYNGKMWVMGGYGGSSYKNDVWWSTNGITWTQATASAEWSVRDFHTSVVYDDKMWVMGGYSSGGSSYKNDVWWSTDGITWTQATASAEWSVRSGPTSVVYDDKMWVMGGSDGSSYKNDVWWYTIGSLPDDPDLYPVTVYVYDADTRLPLSGDWEYYIVVRGSDSVSGSASGAFKVLNLPVTSILRPHLLRVTKEGYEQTAPLAFDVPVGGREVKVYLTPLETTAPEGSSVVTFVVTDIETGTPRGQCLVNVDGVGKYAGASGSVWFVLPENTTHQWLVTAEGYWPIGGDFTLGVDDLVIPVEMTKKTSELPRPPMPGIPGLPVIHPSLDPAGFRMQILNVPIIGGLAAPLLDTMDALAFGLNDIVEPVLDFATAPADSLVEILSGVGDQLTESVATYTEIAGVLLGSVGKLLAVFPAMVVGLVSYNLVLDLVYLLLRGGL